MIHTRLYVHVILEVLTLVEIGAAEVLVNIVDLVLLSGGCSLSVHRIHEDLLLLLHAADPLHVDLNGVEVYCGASTAFLCLHFIYENFI